MRASVAHHEDTTFSDRRPPLMRSMFAACFASSAGAWNVGRTATMISSRSVTAASAAAVLQASSEGASMPLMSFRLSSATSVRSNPSASLRRASRLAYSHVADIPSSSSTFLSQPPNTGSQ
jgi:hypothetical protein